MGYDGTLKFDTSIATEGFQSGISAVSKIAGSALKATAAVFVGAATAVAGIGTAALKVGAEFDAAMSKVEAISGATGDELQALRDKAIEMGDKTKYSATESAEAFNYMAMAGWKTGDMLDGIEGIMNLAAASGEDLATTSDIVTDALTAFGLSAADSTHFADVLAQASANANTNVGLMGETFKYVAPVAGALGFSAEDTATAIGLMANAGIKGSQAGTALRSIMSRMAKPTDEVKEAMYALGVSLTDSEGNMNSLNTIMGDLREGFAGLSEAEAAQMAAAIGGQEAMSGLLAIVNASDADFEKLEASIYSCDGAAEKMADTMNDNLSGQLTILKGQLETFGIMLSDDVQEPMKDVVKEAQNMVSELKDAYTKDGLEGLVSATGDVLAQAVAEIAAAAPKLISTATDLVSSFCDGIKNNAEIGESAAGIVAELGTAVLNCAGDLWTTAITLAGEIARGIADGTPEMMQAASDCITDIYSSFMENLPMFFDAGNRILQTVSQGLAESLPQALQGGIDIVLELGRGISESIPTLIPIAVECILGLLDTFVSNVGSIVDVGIDIIMAIADGIVAALPTLIQKAPDIIIDFWKAFDQNLAKILMAGVELVTKLIAGIVSAIPDLIANLPKILEAIVLTIQHFNFLSAGKSIITSIAAGIKNAGGSLITAVTSIKWGSVAVNIAKMGVSALNVVKTYLAEAILNLIVAVGEFFMGLPEKIWDAISSAIPVVVEWGTQLYTAIADAVSGVVTTVGEFLANLPETIAYWLGFAIGTFISWGAQLVTWAITELPIIIDSIVTWFSQLPDRIGTWLTDTITRVIQWGANLLSSAGTAASGAVNSVVTWFSQLPGKIWTWLSNAIAKLAQFGSNMASKASSAASGFVSNIVSGLSSLPSRMVSIGSNIVQGIWNGISSGWNWLKEKVSGLADSLLKGVKDALGINSPSKVFAREVGRWIPPGIGSGVESAMPALETQMKDEMNRLALKMKHTVDVETGSIAVQTKEKAQHKADTEAQKGGDTYVDQHIEQENNYHVPVATPSETSKAQREAARKLLGGVK